uniref:Uncharacterized protein n=1 Tax=Romanomermis culicivorax TaxID=13658 RepID=A0A915L4B5_ROMCU
MHLKHPIQILETKFQAPIVCRFIESPDSSKVPVPRNFFFQKSRFLEKINVQESGLWRNRDFRRIGTFEERGRSKNRDTTVFRTNFFQDNI